jgi:YD repeat-containing protein
MSAQNADPLDALATLGNRTKTNPFLPVARSISDGANINFVSTAKGTLSFAVTDLELYGTSPIMFQRVYSSDNREDAGLGMGWSFIFDDSIKVDENEALMTLGNGAIAVFRRTGGTHFVLQADEPNQHQSFDIVNPNTIVEETNNFTRTYTRIGNAFHLTQIRDANDNTINISFDARNHISRISNGAQSISLEWSNDTNARLVAVSDTDNRRVTFEQNAQGLRKVTDAAGAEWTFKYEGGQLTHAFDPTGRLLLRARYDNAGRAIEVGDVAGSYRYAYDTAAKRTTVSDPLGAQTSIEHNARGAITTIISEDGQKISIERDAAHYPVRISNSLGDEMKFEYDAQHRLTRQTSSDGREQVNVYDERGWLTSKTETGERTVYERDTRGNVISATSSNSQNSYRAKRDARGKAISVESDAGAKLAFEYDAAGNEIAFTTAKQGRFEKEFDAAGKVVAHHLPSGTVIRYERDARGNIKKQYDNRGHSVTFERDASGAVTGVVMANGVWVRATRDDTGRIVELKNSFGKSRRFAYDARGALTDYTDAQGNSKHIEYDRKGLLTRIIDSDGRKTVIQRDKHGRRIGMFVADKRGARYEYDANGNPLAVRRSTSSVRFEKANFTFASATVQDPSCLFEGDGWFPDDNFYADFGMDCWDSFGGFGDDSGIDFLGLGDSSSGCAKCLLRVTMQCQLSAVGCVTTRGISAAGSAAGICAALAAAGVITSVTAPEASVVCAAIAFQLALCGCQAEAFSCILRDGANCPCNF